MSEDLTPDELAYEAALYIEHLRQYAQRGIAAKQALEAGPRPNIPLAKPLEQMTPEEQADYIHRMGIASLERYAGRPELLMEECPHRDFRKASAEARLKDSNK